LCAQNGRGPLVCSSQGIDTSGNNNPCGKFQLDVLKAVCEFERNLIRDRVDIGLAAARAKGVQLGRPKTLHKRAGEVLALKRTAWACEPSAASWAWQYQASIAFWLQRKRSGS
jgi:DNA invertase Pin-like site-specific DNA recombinase